MNNALLGWCYAAYTTGLRNSAPTLIYLKLVLLQNHSCCALKRAARRRDTAVLAFFDKTSRLCLL